MTTCLMWLYFNIPLEGHIGLYLGGTTWHCQDPPPSEMRHILEILAWVCHRSIYMKIKIMKLEEKRAY